MIEKIRRHQEALRERETLQTASAEVAEELQTKETQLWTLRRRELGSRRGFVNERSRDPTDQGTGRGCRGGDYRLSEDSDGACGGDGRCAAEEDGGAATSRERR